MARELDPFGDAEAQKPTPAPAAGPRPDEGPMDDSEFQSIVSGLIDHSIDFIDSDLAPDRAKATDYYKGRPFGNEETGRSQVVLTEVRDGVLAVMPSMLRVVFGAERPCEFAPRFPEDVAAAEQATDYVNHVFSKDNPGFLLTHSVIKDGLVRKLGFFKWGWDESSTTQAYQLDNLSGEQVELLAADPEVTLTRILPSPITPQMFSVEFTREETDGRACIWAIPPEEIIFTRDTRSQDDAIFFGHRTDKTRGELIAMGVKPEDIDEHGGKSTELSDSEEAIARSPDRNQRDDPEAGEANEKHRYVEGYAHIDYDGDGVAELRRVCTIGTGNFVVENAPVECAPFSIFCPDPEPHTLVGGSWADRLMDMQTVKSFLARAMNDSLAASIFSRTWYKEGDASVADVMNTAIGAPIRTRSGPNAVGVFAHDFKGREVLPVLAYYDDVIERRTGQDKGAQGLNADALQSTTPAAVAATVSASQQQAELLVRIFVETCLKPMFRGLLKLLVTHQPRARMVRLRNQWVEVDPREWNADMDVTVNVALGSGLVEQKIQTLLGVIEKQESYMQTLGPNNDLVDLPELRYALGKVLELQGWQDTTKFFKQIDPQALAAKRAQAAQQPPPPSPEMMIAQVEAQKAQTQMQAKQAEMQMKAEGQQAEMAQAQQQAQFDLAVEREKIAADIMLQREKMAAEMALKERELELKYEMQVQEMHLQAGERQQAAAQQAAASAQSEASGVSDLRTILAETQAMVQQLASGQMQSPAPAPSTPEVHVHVPRGKKRITVTKGDNGYVAESEEM